MRSQLACPREAVPAHWPLFRGSAKEGEGLDAMLDLSTFDTTLLMLVVARRLMMMSP